MIKIKTEKQIQNIRKSCQLAANTLTFIEPYVVEGRTTEELDQLIEQFIIGNGAIPATLNYKGYPKSCCVSLNEVVCHGIPDKTKLKSGDILNIDVTTILDGYFGDTSTMFSVGEISEDAKKLLEVTKKSLEIGIKQCYAGNRLGNIGYEINKYVVSQGFSTVFSFCGHGTGIDFHEDPSVSHIAPLGSGPIIKPGMIFTIEPMINQGKPEILIDALDTWTARTVDGKLSAQYEHTILITNHEPEILTLPNP